MSGGRVELGHRRRLVRAGAHGVRHPVPGTGERFDRLEEQLAIITGLWATPTGERFSHDGRALPAHRLAGAAQAGAAAAPAGADRRHGQAAHAGAGGAVRRRVQPAVRRPRTDTARSSSRVRAGLRGRRPRPRRADLVQRAVLCCRRRRGRGAPAAPRRSAGTSTSCARTASPARRPRSSTRSAGTPSSAPARSTSRCSTSPTSTTSSWWPRRSCRSSECASVSACPSVECRLGRPCASARGSGRSGARLPQPPRVSSFGTPRPV